MIEELIIHRFRGIYKGRLEDFAGFNLLVGPNNTGKSAVLEMLYLAGVCGRECGLVVEATGDRFNAAVPLENDFLGFNPCPRLWTRHGEKEEWEKPPGNLTEGRTLEYHLPLGNEDLLLEFRLVPPPSEEVEYGGFSGKDKKSIAAFALPGAPEIPAELIPFKDEIKNLGGYVFLYQWYGQFIYKYNEKGLSTWALGGKRPDPGRVLFFDFHTAYGNFRSNFFQFARTLPDWYRKIERSLEKIFPDMRGCRVEMVPAGEKEIRGEIRLPGRKPLPVDAFGDGARHAFKVLAGLVARLEADPTTDWRRVDLEAVRRHLADLERVTLAAEVRAEELPGGVGLTVTGPDPASVAAIRRLLPERAARLAEARRWKVATVTVPEGLRVEVRSLDPREAGRIRALGLTGLLVVGPLDEAYLLGLARGEPPPGRPGR